ncbi:MAG: PEP-CTERM sorting domain-containing protein [Planctomycetia bacterium]|nr:PEP-CTERM sorting domain-containing protein [Planctomycetia bacterium]
MFSISCICVLGAAHVAQATTVTTAPFSAWPTSGPGLQLVTYNAFTSSNDEERLNTFRTDIYQSFRVNSTFTLTQYDLALQPFSDPGNIQISIYTKADTLESSGGNPTLGTLLYQDSFSMAEFSNFNNYGTQEFTLTSGEQFTLSPQTSPAGYILWIHRIDGGADPILRTQGRTGNPYADGQGYANTESFAGEDFALALFGEEPTAAPEPSTYALGLFGLAGLGLVAWRRSRVRG